MKFLLLFEVFLCGCVCVYIYIYIFFFFFSLLSLYVVEEMQHFRV